MAPQPTAAHPAATTVIRHTHLPLLLIAANAMVMWAAATGRDVAVVAVVAAALSWTFLAERLAPYHQDWNVDRGDTRRDLLYAALNEALNVASIAVLPLLAGWLTVAQWWPTDLPFVIQVLGALLVLDAGITFAHVASHRIGWLWRFHAVHHSVTRFYGLNGLMKHPIHQAIEMTAGVTSLLFIGIPQSVAVAVAGCVAIQLLLQHGNMKRPRFRAASLLSWKDANHAEEDRSGGQGALRAPGARPPAGVSVVDRGC